MSDHGPGPDPVDLDATWGQPRTGAPMFPGGAVPAVAPDPSFEPTADPGGAPTPPEGPVYTRMSMAVPALVLSIAGLACCGITAPLGMALGVADLRAIDRGITDPSRRGAARAAIILGALATALIVIVAAFFLTLALGSSTNP